MNLFSIFCFLGQVNVLFKSGEPRHVIVTNPAHTSETAAQITCSTADIKVKQRAEILDKYFFS